MLQKLSHARINIRMDLFIYPALLTFASLKQKIFNSELHYYSKLSTLILSTSPLDSAAPMRVESLKRFSTSPLGACDASLCEELLNFSTTSNDHSHSSHALPVDSLAVNLRHRPSWRYTAHFGGRTFHAHQRPSAYRHSLRSDGRRRRPQGRALASGRL